MRNANGVHALTPHEPLEGDDSRKDEESVFVRQQEGDNDYSSQIQMGQFDTGTEKQYE